MNIALDRAHRVLSGTLYSTIGTVDGTNNFKKNSNLSLASLTFINKINTTATENDQTTNERQRTTTTTNSNGESIDDDLNLENIKENNPSTRNAPPQRRVSNRHHRVPIRYIEN